jgi:hypothetical protein
MIVALDPPRHERVLAFFDLCADFVEGEGEGDGGEGEVEAAL